MSQVITPLFLSHGPNAKCMGKFATVHQGIKFQNNFFFKFSTLKLQLLTASHTFCAAFYELWGMKF